MPPPICEEQTAPFSCSTADDDSASQRVQRGEPEERLHIVFFFFFSHLYLD